LCFLSSEQLFLIGITLLFVFNYIGVVVAAERGVGFDFFPISNDTDCDERSGVVVRAL